MKVGLKTKTSISLSLIAALLSVGSLVFAQPTNATAEVPGSVPSTMEAQHKGDHWKNLSPEERTAKHKAFQEKMQNMTPEQKEAWKAERKAKFDALPPEKKAEIQKRHEQKHQERMQKFKSMTPEQREAWKADRKAKFDALPPEKKAEIQKRHEERKAKFDALPPEKKAEIMKRHEQYGKGQFNKNNGPAQAPQTAQ